MPLQAEVAKGVKAIWDATAAVTTAVPGGLHYGRVAQGPTSPYASMKVTAGETEHQSGGVKIQKYRVGIRVWSGEDIGSVSTIESAINAAFDGTPLPSAGLTVTGGTALSFLRAEGDLEDDAETKAAEDVVLTSFSWDLTVQE